MSSYGLPPARISRKVLAAAFAVILAAQLASVPAQADDEAVPGLAGLVNKGLVGVGRLPGALRDKFGETFGSGSAMVFDPASWTRTSDGYRGTLYLQPDRGYNLAGTTDYQPRINKLSIVFRPANDPAVLAPVERQRTVEPVLIDTLMLTDADGAPLTSLDPIDGGIRPAAGDFPPMPQGANGRISLDAEGIVLLRDGGFFISDEYGPYIYRFSAHGRMLAAIRPPDAFIPRRNGRDNFSSNNPGPGAAAPEPPNPQTGRQNNQGFEGLSLTPDGKFLVALLQSATRQDGGDAAETRGNTRMLVYDLADLDHPRLVREHVVPLPAFVTDAGKRRIAAQSELLALDALRFLVICRDSDNGYGKDGAASQYRRIVLADVSGATNIAGTAYDGVVPVAPKGVLAAGIVPAAVVPFIDINDNAQLGRFGLHNGPPADANDLTEKWESLALAPALDPAQPHDFFLFVGNDNDFVTQNGFQVGEPYKDPSGVDLDTMFLVYRVSVPALVP
jgi:hypothetical protein